MANRVGVRESAFGVAGFTRDYMRQEFGYRDLDVWKTSMTLVQQVFELTALLPENQLFVMVSQMQRVAISIPSNIAEGPAKRSGKDYQRQLRIASGSYAELETQIDLCVRLNFVDREQIRDAWTKSQQVGRMLTKLIQSIANKTPGQKRKPTS